MLLSEEEIKEKVLDIQKLYPRIYEQILACGVGYSLGIYPYITAIRLIELLLLNWSSTQTKE